MLSCPARRKRPERRPKGSKDVKASELRSWAYAHLGSKVGQGRPLVAKATQQPSVLGSALDSEGSRGKPKETRGTEKLQQDSLTPEPTLIFSFSFQNSVPAPEPRF